jgi:hypothetical protein
MHFIIHSSETACVQDFCFIIEKVLNVKQNTVSTLHMKLDVSVQTFQHKYLNIQNKYFSWSLLHWDALCKLLIKIMNEICFNVEELSSAFTSNRLSISVLLMF